MLKIHPAKGGVASNDPDARWMAKYRDEAWLASVNLKLLHNATFFQNGAKSGFEMCFGPSTLGAGAKTCLESRIKKITPHCVCRSVIATTPVPAYQQARQI